jgi:Ca-activated chloride channel family protein
MEWQHPQWLYLILPLAAAWLALAVYSRGRRRRAAAAFVAQAMWPRILPADSPARFWVKTLLREAALVTGLVALAGPRFGTQYEEVVPKGSDLYVLIDVSRSMLAQDVPPSRLGRAKVDVAALVNRLEGERVGLIAFAGQAVVKCPLTVDYDAFRRSLDELDPNSAPRGGTAIGDAIRKALEVFQARADRDQAILLITDGDDQQSYPREAAAVAAERHVTIFTVGLGDTDHGARIPQGADAKSYLEYQGQQVWSKLDGSLLKDIALKTSGVYVPVGTRAYDLGELYAKYLQGRRGGEEQTKKRIRRGDRFQIFLALAVLALLADALIRPYARPVQSAEGGSAPPAKARRAGARAPAPHPAAPIATALALLVIGAGVSRADNPAGSVREGLRLYGKGDFAKARDSFAAAREQFDRSDAAKAAIAAFDQACAAHRKGDAAQAKEWYLKAGLAHDKRLAASAHFNLGTLAGEEARRLAGEHPETVAPDKRPEILDQLKGAVASFRHCLELEPGNAAARRDIELVRQWVKYYGDRWHAHDREKRRRETNLLAFVEFLMEAETALAESVKALTTTAPADAYVELKRAQDELLEEIHPLKEKIKTELQPPKPAGGGTTPQPDPKAVQQGIDLLQNWASNAGEKMGNAARQLDRRKAEPAAADQQAAVEELEKIWEALIPFHPLLARDLADQTLVAQALAPPAATQAKPESEQPAPEEPPSPAQHAGPASLGTESEDLAPLTRLQERTQRRTQLLKLKAEAEREALEKAPPPDAQQKEEKNEKNAPSAKPDPEQLKAGYQKAIELAPRAVEQMEHAVKALKQKDRPAASAPAEEARTILEEIQKAQPRDDQKEQEKKKEEQQKQEPKDQPKKDEPKKDEQKKDEQKKDEQKKDEQKKQQEPGKSEAQKKEQPQPKPQVSPDQVESVLRKVRERQQEKRERDRMVKARVSGRAPVEKDW